MVKLFCSLALLATCHAFSHTLSAEDGLAAKYPLLATLVIPEELLPRGCKLRQPSELPKKLEGLPNGQITAESALFGAGLLVGGERFASVVQVDNVEAMYVGVYYEVELRENVGIIGWACRSEEAATQMRDKLAEGYKNETDRYRLWLRDKSVAWLFRNPGGSDGCFRRLEMIVQSRFAGDLKATDSLIEDDRFDQQAAQAALQFMNAFKAEDLDAVMDSVQIPFFLAGNKIITTRDELRHKFAEIFQKKALSELEFALKGIHRFEFAEWHLDIRDRETLKQILENDDRLVLETTNLRGRPGISVVMVRIKLGLGKVAGLR